VGWFGVGWFGVGRQRVGRQCVGRERLGLMLIAQRRAVPDDGAFER
jgi:hypothetical protein